MNYIEILIEFPEDKKYLQEIIVAFLAEQGFDSFTEENNTLAAYVVEETFDTESLKLLMQDYDLKFSQKIIPQQNWNEEWEKNFSPIVIENYLAIKAPFHSETFDTKETIIIEPKMSFGTGHHATTYMMCKLMAEFDFSNKDVLDMGCGTGILAIYASLLGAKSIVAIDIDEWAYENTVENVNRNNRDNIISIKGDVESIPVKNYDYILANINLNILKKDIPAYSELMSNGSKLFLSGFFETELIQIKEICEKYNLVFNKNIELESWTACIFAKA